MDEYFFEYEKRASKLFLLYLLVLVVADCHPAFVLVEGFVLDCGGVSDARRRRRGFFFGLLDRLRGLLFGLGFFFVVELVEELLVLIYFFGDLVLDPSLIFVFGGLKLHLVLRQPRESLISELYDLLHFFEFLQRNGRRVFHINHFLLIEVGRLLPVLILSFGSSLQQQLVLLTDYLVYLLFFHFCLFLVILS